MRVLRSEGSPISQTSVASSPKSSEKTQQLPKIKCPNVLNWASPESYNTNNLILTRSHCDETVHAEGVAHSLSLAPCSGARRRFDSRMLFSHSSSSYLTNVCVKVYPTLSNTWVTNCSDLSGTSCSILEMLSLLHIN